MRARGRRRAVRSCRERSVHRLCGMRGPLSGPVLISLSCLVPAVTGFVGRRLLGRLVGLLAALRSPRCTERVWAAGWMSVWCGRLARASSIASVWAPGPRRAGRRRARLCCGLVHMVAVRGPWLRASPGGPVAPGVACACRVIGRRIGTGSSRMVRLSPRVGVGAAMKRGRWRTRVFRKRASRLGGLVESCMRALGGRLFFGRSLSGALWLRHGWWRALWSSCPRPLESLSPQVSRVCVASAAGVLGREAAGCAAFSWIGSRHDHEGEAVENESARAARGSSRRPGPVLCACLG